MFAHAFQPEVDIKFGKIGSATPVPLDIHHMQKKEPKVAVLLNANAKRVSERVRKVLSHVVSENDLFLTRTFEEARQVAETVVERRYSTVFTGGGDGTFCGFLNEILDAVERQRQATPLVPVRQPRFGVLKLGTGNALAGLCKASSASGDALVDDVLRARANEVPGVRKLELMLTEGKRALFAGLGVDAGILNHYSEIKNATSKTPFFPFSKIFSGGTGYALAIAGRSVPTYLFSSRPNIEIRNHSVAYRVGPDGKAMGNPIAPGSILYQGPALMAAASTVPCYGFNFRLFPFAGLHRGMMHLRVADLALPKVLPNIYPRLWEGRWFPEGLYDFLAEDIEMRSDRKIPFQISGDAEGYRDSVRLSMWKGEVELLDFG